MGRKGRQFTGTAVTLQRREDTARTTCVNLVDTKACVTQTLESDFDTISVTTQGSGSDVSNLGVDDCNRPLLRIRDAESNEGTELVPNCLEPFVLDNAVCKGRAIVKVRTTPENPTVASYFAGRKRMYEIQVEGELKSIRSDETIFVGIQSDGPMRLKGMFSWAAAKVVTTLIRTTTSNSHVSLGNKEEVCHVALPLHTTADTFIVTEKGEELPALSLKELPQENAIPRAERSQKMSGYKRGEIYSFSMHGMYVDLENWRLVNVPKMPPVSITRFLGDMPLYFVAYVLPINHSGPHSEDIKQYLFRFRIEHGVFARKPES
eukprot:CFRG0100T1